MPIFTRICYSFETDRLEIKVMLGRDIEIINPIKSSAKRKVFYPNELTYNGLTKKNDVRPPTDLKIGMHKLQARGWFTRYLVDYANTAVIHGVNHLVAPNRNIWERIATLIILLLSMAAVVLLSLHFWDMHENENVVTVIDHNYRDYSFQLPSIVICPIPEVDIEKFPKVLKKYGIIDTEDVRNFLRNASRIPAVNTPNLPDVNINPNDVLSILYELKPDIKHSMNEDPKWVITPRGICVEFFNAISEYSEIGYWQNITLPYIKESTFEGIPRCNYNNPDCPISLEIRAGDAFWIAITESADIATIDMFTQVAGNASVTIELNVDVVVTSNKAMELSEERRKCRYWSQRNLETWPYYTKKMCLTECATREMMRICNCIFHFYRPISGSRFCDLAVEGLYKFRNYAEIDRFFNSPRNCSCPNDCFVTKYIYRNFKVEAKSSNSKDTSAQIDVLFIFPKRKFFRTIHFTFLDFLAAVGGGVGLLMGASFLSVMEFFYFFTLRLYWHYLNIRRVRRRKSHIIRSIMRKKTGKLYFKNSL